MSAAIAFYRLSVVAPGPRLDRIPALLCALTVVLGMIAYAPQVELTWADGADRRSPVGAATAEDAYADLPLSFVPNRGRLDDRVAYSAAGDGYSFFFTKDGVTIRLQQGESSGHVMRLDFVGATGQAAIAGRDRAPGRTNYLIGDDPAKWQTSIPTFQEVVYSDLWPGIDMSFHGDDGALKYEFAVAPGADPRDIALAYRGAGQPSLAANGDLMLSVGDRLLRDSAPITHQRVNGRRRIVASGFTLDAGHQRFGFQVGDYDAERVLIVDPGLAYSTYLGGARESGGSGIAVEDGNAYVTGFTLSSDFPTTLGSYQAADPDRSGTERYDTSDVFVTKLADDGSGLVYSTFLGGSSDDGARDIAVEDGNAYVVGSTGSNEFPTTAGSFQAVDPDHVGMDAFVTKLTDDGAGLVYSSYLGGPNSNVRLGPMVEWGTGIAVEDGNVYVVGTTGSDEFPTTAGSFEPSDPEPSGWDVFVSKFTDDGSGLQYSTYLGGNGPQSIDETGDDIAVENGYAYVTGTTNASDFPTTAGSFQPTNTDALRVPDAFVTKVATDGTALVYSTYLGGQRADWGFGIAVEGANAYITGDTASRDFPTTTGVFQPETPSLSNIDAFVTKLDVDGAGVDYSTYVGASMSVHGMRIATEGGRSYVTGWTGSVDFPTTPGAHQETDPDDPFDSNEAFVFELNELGSDLEYSTYLGGTGSERGNAIAVEDRGVYVTGTTKSNDFPTSAGAFQSESTGRFFPGDVFVTKFDLALPDPERIAFTSARFGNQEIWTMNHDGTDPVRLTFNPARDNNPAFSPDGSRIAFVSTRTGNPEIWTMDSDGSDPTQLTFSAGGDFNPSFSNDGTMLAFTSNRAGGALDIYTMAATGGPVTRLTDSPGKDATPTWSPDDSRIAFASMREGNFEIFTMEADGDAQTRITSDPANDVQPHWSPVGDGIAFASDRDGDFDIFTFDLGTGTATQLTDHPSGDATPGYSQDGTRIAFSSTRNGGNLDVFVMDAAGGPDTRLTTHPRIDTNPSWGPAV